MRDDPAYTRDYILLANFIVMAFIPFLILTVINSMLYQTITRSTAANKRSNNRQKRDQNIAMILVGIVVVFVFCNIFRIIINLYEVLNFKNIFCTVCFLRYFILQYTEILRKTGQNGKFIVKPRPKTQTPKAQPQPSQIQSKSVPKGLGLTLKSYTTPPHH